MISLLTGCKRYYETPLQSLVDSPIFLSYTMLSESEVKYQEEVGDSKIIIYSHPSPTNGECLSIAYIAQFSKGWRAQSGSTLGCQNKGNTDKKLQISGLIGGNSEEISIAYGKLASDLRLAKINVVWSDGDITQAKIQNGIFMNYRLDNILPSQIDLLDAENYIYYSVSY